jgi:hypothetical protein
VRWLTAFAGLTIMLTAAHAGVAAQELPQGVTQADGRLARAARTQVAIRVDGALDEAIWATAAPITAFVQREPREGAAPTLTTEARVAFDASALYIGVHAYDPEPGRIIGYLTRRDAGSSSDWVHVLIDSYHDRRTAYQFGINPAGVKFDSYWFNDDNEDSSWDAVWDASAARTSDGWTAEFRIPYSQLRFSRGSDGDLGFAITRTVSRLSETSTWPLLARSATGWVSQFGVVTGLSPERSSKRLELIPYVVGQLVTAPPQPGNPLHQSPDPGASVGVDLRYAVTPALSLTGTVNPDFGQVEADPAVVNLGAFETFFNERRPFFIEGSGTYNFPCFDCNLFYSRRIGRQPRGSPPLADDEYAVQPLQSTILGAAKLTGRVGAFSVGTLTAATQEETARIATPTGRRNQIVEPATFYTVSRARREFTDQSSVGFMLTTTNRRMVDSVAFLPGSAVTGGLDYDWRLRRRFSLNGYWAGSSVRGSTEAIALLQRSNVHSFQRPDADHVEFDPSREALNGHSGLVTLGKISGERTRFNFSASYRSPGFDVNDVGFMQRADGISESGWFQLRWQNPRGPFRESYLNFNQWSHRNFGLDLVSSGANINGNATLKNLWNFGGGFRWNGQVLDDRLTRGGPAGYVDSSIGSWQWFNTNDRKVVSFHWNSGFFRNADGSRGFDLNPFVQVRPGSALSAEVGVSFARNNDEAQWVARHDDSTGTHYVFGALRQRTSSMTLRLNYTLTPNLSLQLYGQPFVSAGRYDAYKELIDGRAPYATRFAPFDYPDNADFKVLSFRTTNVMRWEFTPGSTLFVVWQQGREGFNRDGTFRFRSDYGGVFDTPSTNTVLVKLSYWLNP